MSKNLGLISMHVKVMTPTDRQRSPPPNPLLLVIGRVGDGDRVNVGTRPLPWTSALASINFAWSFLFLLYCPYPKVGEPCRAERIKAWLCVCPEWPS